MMISVIIPIYREKERIQEILRSLLSVENNVSYEVIVVDGDPEGSTIVHVRDSRIITLMALKGRAKQMNSGATQASGDILLFLHADTILPQNAFQKIAAALADGRYVGGAFDLGFQTHRWIYRLIGKYASLKHRLTRVPYGDQAIFIRKTYFETLGGYADIPLMEDIELMKRIKRHGGRIIILSDTVSTSTRKWEKDGVIYTIFRNWSLQALYLFGVPAERLVQYYYRE